MPSSSPCPDASTLRELLDGALEETLLGEVEDHVERCPACQDRLAHLSSPTANETRTWRDEPAEGEERLAARLKRDVPPEFRGSGPDDRTRWSFSNANIPLTASSIEQDRLRLADVLAEAAADFEILEEVGRGGMGVVFKARDKRLDRLVAIKIMRIGLEGAETWNRFRREAFAAARLQHPNIIQLFDVGEDGRAPYLIMEFVPGATLGHRLRQGPLSFDDAIAMMESMARAIDHAHGRGIVHRDLKPTNVLIGPGDSLKIADFGLAKLLDRPTGESGTRRGALIGTPHYMSPEQAKGESATAGPAADVYALGAIFYEMLTGTTVFHGASPSDIVRQVREAEPIPPSQRRHGLPIELDAVCLRCLRKDPKDRFSSAAEFADELSQWREHRTVRTRLARPSRKGEPSQPRRPIAIPALSAALAASLVLCAILGSTALRRRGGEAEGGANPPPDQPAAAGGESEDAGALRDALRKVLDAPASGRPRAAVALEAAERIAEPEGSGASRARDLARIARAQRELGRAGESRETLRRAADAARKAATADPAEAPGLAPILLELARSEREAGIPESARAAYEAAIAWLRGAGDAPPAPPARALMELADAIDEQEGQANLALARNLEAVELLQSATRGGIADRDALSTLAGAWMQRARLGGKPQAPAAWTSAMLGWDRLYNDDPTDPVARRGLAESLEGLGESAWDSGNKADAPRVFERARMLRAPDLDADGLLAQAIDEERYARGLMLQGKAAQAAEALDRGARLLERLGQAPPPRGPGARAIPKPAIVWGHWAPMARDQPGPTFGISCYLAALWPILPDGDRADGEAALKSALAALKQSGFSDADRLRSRSALGPFRERP